MNKGFNEKEPLMRQVKELKVGETLVIPLRKYMTCTANIAQYRYVTGMRWTTHVIRDKGVFEVRRTK